MEFSLHLPSFLKMQGNEVEAVKTPTVRACLKNTKKGFIVERN
jgi:hypothetical protein